MFFWEPCLISCAVECGQHIDTPLLVQFPRGGLHRALRRMIGIGAGVRMRIGKWSTSSQVNASLDLLGITATRHGAALHLVAHVWRVRRPRGTSWAEKAGGGGVWRWRLRHPITGIHCIIVRALDGQFLRVFLFFALKEWVATCSALTASSSKVRYSDERQFFQARDLTRLEDLWSSQILTIHISLISKCLGDMPVRTVFTPFTTVPSVASPVTRTRGTRGTR